MKRKKMENRLAKRVFAGKITLAEAQDKLGRNVNADIDKRLAKAARHLLAADALFDARDQAAQKSAVPSLAKAESGPERPGLQGPRYPGDEEYILSAFAPIRRPAVTKAAVLAPREDPRQTLEILKSMQSAAAEVPPRPAHYWTGIQRALLRKSQADPGPQERENARATLARELGGKVVF